jgi:hypothetical protein
MATDLKAKYPRGIISLSYSTLNDAWGVLHDDDKFKSIAAASKGSHRCLQSLRKVLSDHQDLQINQGLAFVQIHLEPPFVGYQTQSDLGGQVTALTAEPDCVSHLADFADNLLQGLFQWSTLNRQMETGSAPVSETFKALGEIDENPFVSGDRRNGLLLKFKSSVDVESDDFRVLKKFNAPLHDRIVAAEPSPLVTQYGMDWTALLQSRLEKAIQQQVISTDPDLYVLRKGKYVPMIASVKLKSFGKKKAFGSVDLGTFNIRVDPRLGGKGLPG